MGAPTPTCARTLIPQAIPDLSALSSLTDLSAGGNRLAGPAALGALPACLTKLVLRENSLGEVPLTVLGGLPQLQVGGCLWLQYLWCCFVGATV